MTTKQFSYDHVPVAPKSFCFLGGIHGVGKTSICERFFSPAGFHCTSASTLIKRRGKAIHTNKRVEDVEDNQTALLQQLKTERGTHEKLLLDGHFSLVTSNNKITPIAPDVFRAMDLDLLILIKGDPQEVSGRLANRDSNDWTPDFLEKFQSAEEQHAIHISDEISVPLRVYWNLNAK